MAIVQSTKTAGSITVEATSPGLAPVSVTISAKATTLRPQVAVWEREAPIGSGITGLWRPLPNTGEAAGFIASIIARGETLFTLRQDGSSLTGTVEGSDSGDFGAKNEPLPIEEGRVEGDSISFKLGRNMFSGTVKSDRIELLQKADSALQLTSSPNAPAVRRPAIGPPPDGSDPSAGPGGETPPSPFALHRVQR